MSNALGVALVTAVSSKAFEQALGAPLFERGPRGMTLTLAGQAFHRRVHQIVRAR